MHSPEETPARYASTSYTSLFPQDMMQDRHILHWNIIHKPIRVA